MDEGGREDGMEENSEEVEWHGQGGKGERARGKRENNANEHLVPKQRFHQQKHTLLPLTEQLRQNTLLSHSLKIMTTHTHAHCHQKQVCVHKLFH